MGAVKTEKAEEFLGKISPAELFLDEPVARVKNILEKTFSLSQDYYPQRYCLTPPYRTSFQ